MTKLSAVIITYNEEQNIERCLLSVHNVADEIIVVDSFSTDATKHICEKYKVRFVEEKWLGYAEQKNFGNQLATNNWILSLDADEALSDTLKQSIIDWKNKELNTPASFNRLTNYCGHWVKHGGWYPDVKLRLFNRKQNKWEGYIHEKLTLQENTKVHHLQGDCLHYSYYNTETHYIQAQKFSTMSAEDLFRKGKKSTWFKRTFSPSFRFVNQYFFKLGFLDGKAGWQIAKISAHSVKLKYNTLRQLYD